MCNLHWVCMSVIKCVINYECPKYFALKCFISECWRWWRSKTHSNLEEREGQRLCFLSLIAAASPAVGCRWPACSWVWLTSWRSRGWWSWSPSKTPTARISLVVCLGGDGSLLRVSQMLQDSMYYFIWVCFHHSVQVPEMLEHFQDPNTLQQFATGTAGACNMEKIEVA